MENQSINPIEEQSKEVGVTENATAPTMRRTIGGTTYIVTAHFSKTSKETMSDKICRMIRKDIENGNY